MAKDFIFKEREWFAPNTYSSNFKTPPHSSGVYLLIKPTVFRGRDKRIEYQILYVGSSKNLYKRYSNHETLRVLKQLYGYVQFYFLEDENHLETEKELIKQIQPPFNTQWL